MHVRALGDGPPLLLINGLGGHTGMWEPLERELGGFRIVEFDLPAGKDLVLQFSGSADPTVLMSITLVNTPPVV